MGGNSTLRLAGWWWHTSSLIPFLRRQRQAHGQPSLPKDYFKILLFLKGSLGLGRKRNEKLACVCVSLFSLLTS